MPQVSGNNNNGPIDKLVFSDHINITQSVHIVDSAFFIITESQNTYSCLKSFLGHHLFISLTEPPYSQESM